MIDEKIDLLKHPDVRYTADGDTGLFRHGTTIKPSAAIVIEEDIDPGSIPEYVAYDGDYILLSDEDLEELISQHEEDF